ncbi:hypothetical protein LPJ55_005693 [Coemansia sp. RSA 990]|nr:hypothetical protein LPJ55_005693 [Coemansia sp. RSA 990]
MMRASSQEWDGTDRSSSSSVTSLGINNSRQNSRSVRYRNHNGLIDSEHGSKEELGIGDQPHIRESAIVALPETGRPITGGGNAPPEGWGGDLDALPYRRRTKLKHRAIWWLLHFLQVLVLAIIVILLMVAVGVPVSDNGVPQPGDYTQMEFNWKHDPRSYLSPMNPNFTDYNVLLDAHLHTTYSDGVLSPKQAIEYSIANGFNAIIVTDHQTVDGALAAKKYAEKHYSDQITVITGMEYTCCRIHMNLIGINESVTVSPPFPSNEQLRDVINKVHDMGGMVIVNHIPWSNTTLLPWNEPRLPNNPTREQLLDWGVDGFEVVNQNTFDLRSYQFVQEHSDRLVGLTGSDMHYPASSYAWTTINAPNRTAEAILDEIRNRRTSFLLDASGTRPVQDPPYNKDYFKYAPWGLVGDYFYGYADKYRGQYSFQGTFCQREIVDSHGAMMGWFFLWLLVSILVLEVLYWFFRWLVLLVAHRIRRWLLSRRQR